MNSDSTAHSDPMPLARVMRVLKVSGQTFENQLAKMHLNGPQFIAQSNVNFTSRAENGALQSKPFNCLIS